MLNYFIQSALAFQSLNCLLIDNNSNTEERQPLFQELRAGSNVQPCAELKDIQLDGRKLSSETETRVVEETVITIETDLEGQEHHQSKNIEVVQTVPDYNDRRPSVECYTVGTQEIGIKT